LLAFVIKPIPRNGIVAIFRRSNASIRLESLRRDASGAAFRSVTREAEATKSLFRTALVVGATAFGACFISCCCRCRELIHHPTVASRGRLAAHRDLDPSMRRFSERGSLSPRREPAAGVVSFESTAVRKKYSCSPGGEDRCFLKARAAAGAAVDATAAQPHRSRVGIRRSTLIQTIDWSDRHSSPARRAASR
jgi:hypothetical protein